MLIGSEVYSIVTYFRKTDSMATVTTGACSKQETNYSRNPLYGHLIIMGSIVCPLGKTKPGNNGQKTNTFYLFNQRIFTKT